MTARYDAFAAYTPSRVYYGWRFSAMRSVQCATSDREIAGGMTSTRCLPTSRS
jgi:hypothetical protein